MTRKARRGTLAWGLILIVFGFIFLLDTLAVDVWDSVARLWPIILIVWGGWKLYFGIKDRNEAAKAEKTERV